MGNRERCAGASVCERPGRRGQVVQLATQLAGLKPQERSRFSARWPPGHRI